MNTICAISTAHGGAIGIVRTSGPDAVSITDAIFRGKRRLAEARPHSVCFGEIRSDDGELVDEVLVSVFRAPHSYTGEDATEISCHGSTYILQRIIQLLIAHGCEMARPGEYTLRAFLNGKMDLSQAEAVAELIAAKNASTHRIAMQQMRGEYSLRLRELRDRLVEMTALLELELDFSEEDVEFADRGKLVTLAGELDREIATLADSFRLGKALKEGVPVAIIGAPNVGKSTLLNALVHDDRAIVSATEGTTRDLVEDTVTIGDITFRFIDTAGLRHTDNTVERMGIERSLRAAEKAQTIILLTEPGVSFPDIPVRPDQHVLRIVNKTQDFQALSGIGIRELEQRLVEHYRPAASDSALLVTNLRHYEALTLALADIRRAGQSLKSGLSADLVAEDLRHCVTRLGEILGVVPSSEILSTIFARFCVGK